MPTQAFVPNSFLTFGDLLKYLRRKARLTQLELSIAVGYSEAQIGRLEKNQRLPDLTAVKALFVPALHLEEEPELIQRLLDLAQSARQEDTPAPGLAPYKGLLFFDEEDADLFFGREALTARLTEHVLDLAADSSSRLLAVVGASGSGKSSLMRAGLAMALKRVGWDVRIFTPTGNPIKILEANLNSARDKNAERVLILVDQFEEVFTLCHDEMDRIAFVEKLLFAAQDRSRKTTVVIALRADFYSHCAQYPLLRQAVAAQQEYIGQMTAEELRRAIKEPAKRSGWEFEPGLVDILLSDIGAEGSGEPEPGALPLLSHALLATWERRRGRTFTLEGYHASGGVRGAIAETAESVFTDQLNQTQQRIAHDVFMRLTELGEGTEDTRRRAALNELVRQSAEAAQLRAVLNTLAEARLITLNEDSAEVAHEALIREWQRLHGWLTQDRESLLLHRHLTESAQEWESRGRDPSELYRGARLAQVCEWETDNEESLNASERAFLTASIEQEQHDAMEREIQRQRELEAARKLAETEKARAEEQASSLKQLHQRGVLLASALIVALIAATNASVFARNAHQEALISSVRELASAAHLNLETDPELSTLLALQAANKTYAIDQTALPEAEDALHRAIQASRVELTITSGAEPFWSAAFSPDGMLILTASSDGTARIWDATTGKELLLVRGSDTQIIWYAMFSPDGKLLATAGEDGIAHIWDAKTGMKLLTFKGHHGEIYNLAFSPDGSRLVTASLDGTSIVWDAHTGKKLVTLLEGDGGLPQWVAYSPNGSRIAVANNTEENVEGWVSIWDATTYQKILTLPHQKVNVRSVSFSPDSTRIVTTGDDRKIKIWDVRNGELLLTLSGHTDPATNAVYSPDGTRVATTSWEGQAKIWDANTGQELFGLNGHKSDIWGLAFNPQGTRVATASTDGTVRVWNVSPSRELLTLVNGPAITSQIGARLAYSPDGTKLAVAYSDPIAKVWDVTTGKLLLSLVGHTDEITFIAYNYDGTQIATVSKDGTAKLWDAGTGKELLTMSGHEDWVIGVAFSPDGSRIATSSFEGSSKVWDSVTGKELLSLIGHEGWVVGVTFSPDGMRIATSSFDSTVRIWDAKTGEQQKTLFGHTDTVRQVVFSPDGSRIATSSFDGTTKVWQTESGKELFTLSGHISGVFSVAFSADNKKIATASTDKTAIVWDALTGERLLTLNAPDGLTSVSFNPDGSQLAVASIDGTARIYLLRIEDLIALAKQRVTRALTEAECQQYLHMEQCPVQP